MHITGTPLSVEVDVSWLLARTDLTTPRPDRRLNAIENLLVRLTRSWRSELIPINPARELRLSAATRTVLLGWVEERDRANDHTRARLAAYASCALVDASVPEGWVRIRIAVPRSRAYRAL